MSQNHGAVLIADVVGSSSLRGLRSLLAQRLAFASREHLKRKWIRLPYSVTAGDEFQTVSISQSSLPELILDLRINLLPLKLRVGVGFGPVPARLEPPVNRLGGPAFVFARTALESIKRKSGHKFDVLTSFRSRDEMFDSTANLVYGLHDTLLLRVTDKQWETIKIFRAKRRLDRAARALDVDDSTVSRNLQRGHFWQMEQTVAGMQALIRSKAL
ncbi:MAG: SatD family protein [Candidatus Acidiferrales bacterium]